MTCLLIQLLKNASADSTNDIFLNRWKDIEARAKKLNKTMNKENKLKTYTHLNDVFRAFMFGLDEGLLSELF